MVDHALDQFLQGQGVLHDTEAVRAAPQSHLTGHQTSCIRHNQRRRIEVEDGRETHQRCRQPQSHNTTLDSSTAAQQFAENLQSASTPLQCPGRSVPTHKPPIPVPVELDMLPDHIIESIGCAGDVGVGSQPSSTKKPEPSSPDSLQSQPRTTQSSEQLTTTSLSSEGHVGSKPFVGDGSRPGRQALSRPASPLLSRTASMTDQPCSVPYSIPDVFDNWQNPVLNRHSVRQPHQSSRDVLHVSRAGMGDTTRQVGGGEHVRIASLDVGAQSSTKRRRREISSTHCPHQERAVDAKRVAADVKLKRSSLQKLRVCGQFDSRVILCTLSVPERESEPDSTSGVQVPGPPRRLLVAVDQHAADERVQLERLTASVYGEAGDQRNIDVVACDAMWAFDTHEHPRLLEHTEVLRSWGFTYTVPRGQRCQTPAMEQGREHFNAGENCHCPPLAAADSALVQMHTVPRVAGVTLAQMHLRKLLGQLSTDALAPADCDQFSRRASSLHFKPTAVSEILAYRACHAAVRFGDQLTHDECCRIISQLAQCRLPFQCAHGRPTLHPIMVL